MSEGGERSLSLASLGYDSFFVIERCVHQGACTETRWYRVRSTPLVLDGGRGLFVGSQLLTTSDLTKSNG